jgi:hypothetical protein
MARIKLVLWERRIAWLQAQEVLRVETARFESEQQAQQQDADVLSKDDVKGHKSAISSSVQNTLGDGDRINLESAVIARLGRKKAPIASTKRSRIGIKNSSRSTSWKVV